MNVRKLLCFLIYLLFCISCAKQGIPSGGPKDSIPPSLISSIPKQKQLNFKQKEIQLVFSEVVFVNNPKEQIIITPSVGKDFDATAKNKVVTFKFDKDLKDSTTYTLSFRDAIKDITEKNSAQNLKLAFSTGPYIDSLSIEGKVLDLLKEKEAKDITVALYQNADTFNIFKNKPAYLTRTDSKGFYKIENLKNGNYYIYAFDDKNRNLFVDSKNESYGFISQKLELTTKAIKNISIPIVRLDSRALKLTGAKPYNNYFNIRTSKNMVNYSVKSDSDSSSLITSFGDDLSTVKVYNTLKDDVDSLKIHFHAQDSIENQVDSTLYLKFSKKEVKPEKFTMRIETNSIEANTGILTIKMSFNKPIAEIDFDSIFFQPDSTVTINFTEQDLNWDFTKNILSIKKKIDKSYFLKEIPVTQKKVTQPQKNQKPGSTKPIVKNNLILGQAAFISIDSDSSKYTKQIPKILREEDTGILRVTIKTSEKNFICQLLTSDFKVYDFITNKSEIIFQNVPPANYMIRFIADKNGNGKWDPGNFFKKIEPEPVSFFKNQKNKDPLINLKANWDIGPMLITYP